MDDVHRSKGAKAGYSGRAWLIVLLTAFYALAVLGMFSGTVYSMVDIWNSSETFTHGYLIAPISVWLIWRERISLSSVPVVPQPRALIATVLAGIAWLVAHQVSVNVVQQLALVCVLISGVWSILGTAFVARIAFPLAFLFLAVPMGEGLIAPLMKFTADTLELMVRASGIPVYREGANLSLPTGNWSVVEACSGVRYLIASFTLGLLYAHLSYRRTWHKLAFVVLSIVVPIIANSLRAYGIVMIGHLSGMELATGTDHLLYGWVFFGLVMILLFWVGSFWNEDKVIEDAQDRAPEAGRAATGIRPAKYVLATVAAVLVSGMGPLAVKSMDGSDVSANAGPLVPPEPASGWERGQDPGWNWQPKQLGADRELDAYFTRGGQPVGLLLRQYLRQTGAGELVPGRQTWRANRVEWKIAGEKTARATAVDDFTVDEAVLLSNANRLLVWAWYNVDNSNTANPYAAKFLEAKQRVLNEQRDGSRIFLATPVDGDVAAARAVLQEFLSGHHEAIKKALESRSPESVPHE